MKDFDEWVSALQAEGVEDASTVKSNDEKLGIIEADSEEYCTIAFVNNDLSINQIPTQSNTTITGTWNGYSCAKLVVTFNDEPRSQAIKDQIIKEYKINLFHNILSSLSPFASEEKSVFSELLDCSNMRELLEIYGTDFKMAVTKWLEENE